MPAFLGCVLALRAASAPVFLLKYLFKVILVYIMLVSLPIISATNKAFYVTKRLLD